MKPLFVDLDGTLLFNDSVQEVFWCLFLQHPWRALIALYMLITQGRAVFKDAIARQANFSHIRWQINPEVLRRLKKEKSRGRKIVLLTASHEKIAKAIVDPLEIFDQVVGSSAKRNFKGGEKLSWIQTHFQGQSFLYAGNSDDDLILWKRADEIIIVNPAASTLAEAKKINRPLRLIQNQPSRWKTIRRMLRMHQYVKNLLVFIPLLLSGKGEQWHLAVECLMAFVSFSAIASANYIINDLIDIDHDRAHRTKKNRPLAAGALEVSQAIMGCIFLSIVALVVCCFLPLSFFLVLMTYFFLSSLYSFFLKKIPVLDVFILSFLYVLRVVAGSVASAIAISNWFFTFALFFFLSLGYLKRYIELQRTSDAAKLKGRGYKKQDLDLIRICGISLGFVSVLVFALYLTSSAVVEIYKHPSGLWVVACILLFWINYMWYVAMRNKMQDDPIEFALKDKISGILGLISVVIVLLCQGLL